MMLKTSSRKINPFCNMLKFTVKKNIGITVILCIAVLLYCPGTYLVNFSEFKQSYYNNYIVNEDLLRNFAYIIAVASGIAVVIFNTINFSFLYKKSSSDVFHAFPLTRTELLLSRTAAGFISTLIPVITGYASFAVMSAFFSWMGSFVQLLYYLLHTVIIILVCSSFSLIFIISAGSMFDFGISLIGGNVALILTGTVFNDVLGKTLIGYGDHAMQDIIYNISPVCFCGYGMYYAEDVKINGVSGQSIEFLIRSVIYIAVFITAAILLYRYRKAEKGGTAYAYKFMYLICSILAGICGGYVVGVMFSTKLTNPVFWIFAAVGAILTTVVYGLVTNRGFKKSKLSVLMGAISAITIASVAIFGVTGGMGYSKRLPQKDKVDYVYINAFGESIRFDNPDDVIALHEGIIQNRKSTECKDNYYDENYTSVSFDYALNNGGSLKREFIIDINAVKLLLLDIYKSDERFDMIKKEIDIDNASEFSLYFLENDEYIYIDVSKQEVLGFIEAYRKDCSLPDAIKINDGDRFYYQISGKTNDIPSHFSLESNASYVNCKKFIEDNNLISRGKSDKETVTQ